MIEECIGIEQIRGHQALVTTAPWISTPGEDGPESFPGPSGLLGELVQIIDTDDTHHVDLGNLVVWSYTSRSARRLHRNCLTITGAPKPAPEVVVSKDVAAHVLFPFEGIGYRAGSFTQALIEALIRADHDNRRRMGLAFPEYAEAVRLAKEEWGGIDKLKRIMRGE
ncbi:hypothetical protein SEA_SOOS_6 [Gordonia phage Soos]|nr:hypothetical protein SEA_SOOS_6 [Gordonia phage Soos]